MNNQLDFIKFKNILNKHNILLFDGEYRIALYNYTQVIKSLEKSEEETNNDFFLINKIKNLRENLLRIFIYSLVQNDINKINYILELVHKN
jgi:hypothetical protein